MIAADHGNFTQGELAFDAGAQPLSAERRIFVVNNVAMRLRGWIPIILICTPVVSRLGSADRQAPDPRAWGTTTSHPHVEASRQARVIRTADTGEGPWPSSGTSAETGEQQGLGVRMAGHRRPLGDRAGAAVGLLHGFEPGRAGRDEFFI